MDPPFLLNAQDRRKPEKLKTADTGRTCTQRPAQPNPVAGESNKHPVGRDLPTPQDTCRTAVADYQ